MNQRKEGKKQEKNKTKRKKNNAKNCPNELKQRSEKKSQLRFFCLCVRFESTLDYQV